MKYFAAVFAVLIHTSLAQESYRNSTPWENGRFGEQSCLCYRKENAWSCRCRDKVRLYVERMSHMELTCADAAFESDPYRYLSLIDAEKMLVASFQITGCPPPGQRYSSLLVRKGGRTVEIGSFLPCVSIDLDCGDLLAFPLNRRHFADFDALRILRIRCPALSSVPEDLLHGISEMAFYVEISNTSLVSLPKGFFSPFKRLQNLSLKRNNLKTFGSMNGLQLLQQLDVKGNKMERLEEDCFKDMRHIAFLDVSSNLITRLPRSLCALKSLRVLRAQYNRIEFVDAACVASLSSLKHLQMEGNRLRTLVSPTAASGASVDFEFPEARTNESSAAEPSAIFPTPTQASRPELSFEDEKIYNASFIPHDDYNINFSENNLISIREAAFYDFLRLEELDLSSNGLRLLPPKLLHRNKFLRTLRLSGNLLPDVPETLLFNNRELVYLDLSDNRIRTLGEKFFSKVGKLEVVNLSNNRIQTLPYGIFLSFIDSFDNGKTLVLNLEGNNLTALPNLRIKRLTELNLARNRLTHLKTYALLGAFSLQRVNLSFNYINATEGWFQNVTHRWLGVDYKAGFTDLHSVDLSHNLLTRVPYTAHEIQCVKHLNLSANRISVVKFGRFAPRNAVLERLDLSNNNLSKMIEEYNNQAIKMKLYFDDLREIKYLDLSSNGITYSGCMIDETASCASFLGKLLRLEELILAHNEIEIIPVHFESLPKLRFVDLSFNKIKKVSHHHLFFLSGLTKINLTQLGDSENNYVQRERDYFEIPNSHTLRIDMRNNEISQVELPDAKTQLVPRGCNVERQFSRATMLLGSNPFVCSCQVFKLLQYAQQEIRPVSEEEVWEGLTYVLPVKVDVRDLSCWEPIAMRGKNLSDPETWAHHLLPLYGLCQHLGHP